MITMEYRAADESQKTMNIIDIYSVYKNDRGNTVLFKVKSDKTYYIIYSDNYAEHNQHIYINDTVFDIHEILKNTDRIYYLMQQELLRDSIDNLP